MAVKIIPAPLFIEVSGTCSYEYYCTYRQVSSRK